MINRQTDFTNVHYTDYDVCVETQCKTAQEYRSSFFDFYGRVERLEKNVKTR